MFIPHRLVILFVAAFVPIGAGGREDDGPRPAGQLELKKRVFRHDGGEYKAEVGRLRVPENRSKPDSRLIEIAFVRLKSTAKKPKPPVVFLAGGPGEAATPKAEGPGWEPLLAVCDLILVDQRGIGQSTPSTILTQPDDSPAPFFADHDTMLAWFVDRAEAAARRFEEAGIDLSGYTTVENAADIDALRTALGVDKISLMAHSYGTHLGLEIIRRYGDHIESFVAAGVAGPNDLYRYPAELDASLKKIAALAKDDPRTFKAIPDLTASFAHALQRVRKKPLVVTVTDPVDQRKVEVAVGEHGLQFIVIRDLGDTADLPALPRFLHQVNNGRTDMLQRLVQKRYDQLRLFPGMPIAMRAASGATSDRWEKINKQAKKSLFGRSRLFPPLEVARALGVPDLGDDYRAPVTSKVRTLFISGTLDANTPPEQAEAIRKGLPNAAHLIIKNAGHEDLLRHPESRRMAIQLFKGRPVADKSVSAPPIRFLPVED